MGYAEGQFPHASKNADVLDAEAPPKRKKDQIGGGKAGPGRHPDVVQRAPATPAEVRALLFMVLDKSTADAMVKSLRRRIAKGQLGALEFLFDRLVGRPAVNVHHEADGALAQFMSAWAELKAEMEASPNLVQAPPLALEAAEYRILDDDMATEDDDNSEDAETGI
jgi:hypothetical protein